MANSQLQFGGEEHFDVSPERLFDALTNLDLVQSWIPDLVSAERVDPQHLKCVVRPGFSFLRGTMNIDLSLEDLDRPRSARLVSSGKGIGTTIALESKLDIEPAAGGSTLHWSTEITQLKGLIATVGKSLIRAAAEQVIKQSWPRIRETLYASPPKPASE